MSNELTVNGKLVSELGPEAVNLASKFEAYTKELQDLQKQGTEIQEKFTHTLGKRQAIEDLLKEIADGHK